MIKKFTLLSTFSGLVFAAMSFNIISVLVQFNYPFSSLFHVLALLTGLICTIGTLGCSCKVLKFVKENANVTEYKLAEKPAKICQAASIAALVLVLLSYIMEIVGNVVTSSSVDNVIYILLIVGIVVEIPLIVGFFLSVSRLNHFKEMKDQ